MAINPKIDKPEIQRQIVAKARELGVGERAKVRVIDLGEGEIVRYVSNFRPGIDAPE